MKTVDLVKRQTPAERLIWAARNSPLFHDVVAPNYLIAVALLVLLGGMIFIGLLGGSAAVDLFSVYVERIKELAAGS